METQNIAPESTKTQWSIDMEWFEKNNRSLPDLARRGLCSKCVEKLAKKKKKAETPDILAAIKDCCGKTPEFVTGKMPLLESIFRIMLANGNEPMNDQEISKQLGERRGIGGYPVSPASLDRLLSNDKWYGFKKV